MHSLENWIKTLSESEVEQIELSERRPKRSDRTGRSRQPRTKVFSRNPERDHALVLLMVRHGLRVSACKLKLSDIDLNSKVLQVKRLKSGKLTEHPLYNGEVKIKHDLTPSSGRKTLRSYTTSDCNANINESIDSLSRSLTPRSAPLLDLRQIDRIFPSEINS